MENRILRDTAYTNKIKIVFILIHVDIPLVTLQVIKEHLTLKNPNYVDHIKHVKYCGVSAMNPKFDRYMVTVAKEVIS